MKNNFYVYEHWRLDRDECFYVGKGKGRRAYIVHRRNMHWKAIVAKLSRIGSAWEVRIVESGLTEKQAFDLEIERIAFWKGIGVDLTNMTDGGEGMSNPSQEVRDRISVSAIGNKHGLGKHHSDAARAEMSVASKNMSAKTREIIACKIRGRTHTPEACVKIGDASRNMGSESRAKISVALGKKTICLDDGKIFPSASEAARHYNVAKSAVIELCSGKNGRKTVGGAKFRYVEED